MNLFFQRPGRPQTHQHDDRHADAARRADILRSYLGEISNSQISTGSSPTLTLTLDEQALGQTADEIQMALRNCNPAVWPDFSPGHLHFHMHSVQDGDEEMLAAKVKEILEAG